MVRKKEHHVRRCCSSGLGRTVPSTIVPPRRTMSYDMSVMAVYRVNALRPFPIEVLKDFRRVRDFVTS